MRLTGGSLFSGMGGLDLAAMWVLYEHGIDLRFIWDSDIKPAARTFLAHRRPHAPNLGDIHDIATPLVDTPPVDVLTFGWPCPPFSSAGKRLGENDPRALWPEVLRVIATLRPTLLFGENVARVAGVGELRRAVRTLAEVGYMGAWRCVRASDVGAPHRRDRLFLLGVRTDLLSVKLLGEADGAAAHPLSLLLRDEPGRGCGACRQGAGVAGDDGEARAAGAGELTLLPTPTANLAQGRGSPSPETAQKRRDAGRRMLDDAITLLTPDGPPEWMMGYSVHGSTPEARPAANLPGVQRSDRPEAVQRPAGGPDALPRPADLFAELWEQPGRGHEGRPALAGETAPEAGVRGVRGDGVAARASRGPESGEQRSGQPGDAVRVVSPAPALAGGPTRADARDCGCSAWGKYAAAIHRWEMVLGRVAPSPTEPYQDRRRLSAGAVEFMMGLPAGWVTDVPGLTRAQQLSMLGDGVVPQQARYAYGILLADLAATAERAA